MQIVSHILLVKTFLIVPQFVTIGGPESAAVGGDNFVDQNDLVVFQLAEFKFRISNDHAALAGIISGLSIEA